MGRGGTGPPELESRKAKAKAEQGLATVRQESMERSPQRARGGVHEHHGTAVFSAGGGAQHERLPAGSASGGGDQSSWHCPGLDDTTETFSSSNILNPINWGEVPVPAAEDFD